MAGSLRASVVSGRSVLSWDVTPARPAGTPPPPRSCAGCYKQRGETSVVDGPVPGSGIVEVADGQAAQQVWKARLGTRLRSHSKNLDTTRPDAVARRGKSRR